MKDEFVPAVLIAPGTQIAPVVQSLVAMPNETPGTGLRLVPMVKPEGMRTPVSLSFGASGVTDEFTKLLTVRGDIVMGAGAQIATDALGSVTMKGQTVLVLGSISAPGGSIAISGGKDSSSLFLTNRTVALPTVDLGSEAVLSTAGRTLLTFDPRGFRTGQVLPGGSIAVSGNLVLESGARLDVSGASDVLFFPPGYATLAEAQLGSLHGSRMVPIAVESNAGAITLQGGQALFTEATLLGAAGGATAQGGSLSVSSGRFYQPGVIASPLDVTLQVTQASQIVLAKPVTGSFIGAPVHRANGAALESGGCFGVDNFTAGGFDALTLGGTVRFAGPVSITARRSLTVADSGVLFADSAVTLTAPYVALGQTVPRAAPAGNAGPAVPQTRRISAARLRRRLARAASRWTRASSTSATSRCKASAARLQRARWRHPRQRHAECRGRDCHGRRARSTRPRLRASSSRLRIIPSPGRRIPAP